jgi:hypothetical protein
MASSGKSTIWRREVGELAQLTSNRASEKEQVTLQNQHMETFFPEFP